MFGSKSDKKITVTFPDHLKVTTVKQISEGAFAYVFMVEDER